MQGHDDVLMQSRDRAVGEEDSDIYFEQKHNQQLYRITKLCSC